MGSNGPVTKKESSRETPRSVRTPIGTPSKKVHIVQQDIITAKGDDARADPKNKCFMYCPWINVVDFF
ncbi:hypothetical protein M378DRAFT_464625 [Amanita muscaria Koide BX008]|uniref:Uncharacterized protein n=1 Tax=Amanita muscaria (strain Koide BX008) TaxID=946122 RepID=A0A0C2TG17_AMAMK|nr:hypothetical protein M378DRAFT_464625 [Amanita muscaria Koide BX008]